MEVAVVGLWHLGLVTAGCLASAGYRVYAHEPDSATVADLRANRLPVAEPGLEELIGRGIAEERLSFSSDPAVIQNADIVWITYDTPVDEEDRADVEFVISRVASLFPHVRPGALILISAQLPVGSTARLEGLYRAAQSGGTARFAYSPENLRLGKAIEVFTRADRFVVGLRSEADRPRIEKLLAPFTSHIEWMTVESAEMTKHAINAFLATSVVFINELAVLCEKVGADAREVERGLKSDLRIGPRAYLKAGAAFAGGTLARDISFLIEQAKSRRLPLHLFESVDKGNRAHQHWPCRRLTELLDPLPGRRVGVLGLTYKPGTNILRRSTALEMCTWLRAKGVSVQAYDPAVTELPSDLRGGIQLCSSAEGAIRAADAVVVSTPWPAFRSLKAEDLVSLAASPLVLDANGHLADQLGRDRRIRYITVGIAA
jgi:UDPglucose 6-dehydrogenase